MIRLVKTKNDLIKSYQLRKQVFIDEQKISYEDEFDLKDDEYDVFLLIIKKKAVATLRCKPTSEGLKVGRVCTLKEYRNKGYARLLMEKMEEVARNKACLQIFLEAQLSALAFYEKLGYKAYGDVFLDANIEHKKMVKKISS